MTEPTLEQPPVQRLEGEGTIEKTSYAGLSTWARNTLLRAKTIYGTDDICVLTDKQIASLRWTGVKTVEELRQHRTRLLIGTPHSLSACDGDSDEHRRMAQIGGDAAGSAAEVTYGV